MADPREETLKLLKAHGAVLRRQKKHEVWALPDGRVFTRSKTPGSTRCDRNELMQVKKLLGLTVAKGEEKPLQARPARQRPPMRAPRRGVLTFANGSQIVGTPASGRNGMRGGGFTALLDSLYAVARLTMPRYRECWPVDREVVLQTPVTTWLRRWLA